MFHIIDDNEFIREVVDELIRDLGHVTKLFECPQRYINYVKDPAYEKPIAIFTDITMPVMDGYEMINIVSNLVSGLKFVVMTGEPSIRSEYIGKSCMYLGKPFKPGALTDVIDKIRQCDNSEPSCKIGCHKVDDRSIFPVENWSCPNACKDCS